MVGGWPSELGDALADLISALSGKEALWKGEH